MLEFQLLVGRAEWKVIRDVEKARGSWGGRRACDSVFRVRVPALPPLSNNSNVRFLLGLIDHPKKCQIIPPKKRKAKVVGDGTIH